MSLIGKKLLLLEETEQKSGRLIKGRQVLALIYERFETELEEDGLYDLQDLLNVRYRGNLERFLVDWDATMQGMSPDTDIQEQHLRTLFREQVWKCPALKTELDVYERAKKGTPERSIEYLRQVCERHIERERKNANRHSSFNTANALTAGDKSSRRAAEGGKKGGKGKNRRPSSNRGKGNSQSPKPEKNRKTFCRYWKKGNCRDGSACRFLHQRNQQRSNSPNRNRTPSPSGWKRSNSSRSYQSSRGRSPGRSWSRDSRSSRNSSAFRRYRDPSPALSGSPKGKGKGKGKKGKNKSEKRDCREWIYKGQCSYGNDCHFLHAEAKKNSKNAAAKPGTPAVAFPAPIDRSDQDSPHDDSGDELHEELPTPLIVRTASDDNLRHRPVENPAGGCPIVYREQ
jgi:hypothetical protein